MPSIAPDPLDEVRLLLNQAVLAVWGIVVYTDDIDLFRARVYKVRNTYPESSPQRDLTVRIHPTLESRVLIVKSNLEEVVEKLNAQGDLPTSSPRPLENRAGSDPLPEGDPGHPSPPLPKP